MGDYKMSQVEQVEADRGRAREDNSYWVQRPEVDRLVAAAVEERDREWRERIENLIVFWEQEKPIRGSALQALEAAQKATQGCADDLRSLLSPVPEIPGLEGTRGQVDGLLVEGRQEPPAVTTSAGVAPAKGEDEN